MADVVDQQQYTRMSAKAMAAVIAPSLMDMVQLEERAESVEKTFQATKAVAKQLESHLSAHMQLRVEAKAREKATRTGTRSSVVGGKMLGLISGAGADGNLTSTSSNPNLKNKVHFGGLEIHHHERVCGGSETIPSSGPPLGLGWNKLHTDTMESFLEWDDARSKQHQEEEDRAREEHEEQILREQEEFGDDVDEEFLPFQYHLDGKLEVHKL